MEKGEPMTDRAVCARAVSSLPVASPEAEASSALSKVDSPVKAVSMEP